MEASDFTELFRRHYDAVLRYAVRRAEPQNAADVATEVFLIAWRRRAELPSTPLPWLIGTTRRVLANQRRTERRADALTLRLRTEPADTPFDAAESVELRQRWSVALSRLTPEDQEVIALIAWDGLTGREAARSLGCGESAFLMRLHRARRRLAKHLAETEQIRPVDSARPTTTKGEPS